MSKRTGRELEERARVEAEHFNLMKELNRLSIRDEGKKCWRIVNSAEEARTTWDFKNLPTFDSLDAEERRRANETHTVIFANYGGEFIGKDVVRHETSATAPKLPTIYPEMAYESFAGWSDDFSKVTRCMVVYAEYKKSLPRIIASLMPSLIFLIGWILTIVYGLGELALWASIVLMVTLPAPWCLPSMLLSRSEEYSRKKFDEENAKLEAEERAQARAEVERTLKAIDVSLFKYGKPYIFNPLDYREWRPIEYYILSAYSEACMESELERIPLAIKEGAFDEARRLLERQEEYGGDESFFFNFSSLALAEKERIMEKTMQGVKIYDVLYADHDRWTW